jgi:hypothetical protein
MSNMLTVNKINLRRTLKVLFIVAIPLSVWAVSWSNGQFSAPRSFREAASKLGLRVTEVCRSANAPYGARNSPHKRCQAMDIGKETPRSKISEMKKYGACGQFHKKGYYGATGDHWHVTLCSTSASRAEAGRDQGSRARDLRQRNRSRNDRGNSGRAGTWNDGRVSFGGDHQSGQR